MELNYKKCGENYKRFLRVGANTWDAQEPAWKISMQKFQSMGSLMEDMNINENGRNQMKRHFGVPTFSIHLFNRT